MIATGLVFVLGALVATLLGLLFVPLLWRNAQRLARRDFAATMPTTMNEIRAEVDRVRAEAAMTVRRHEMLAQKARERLAKERIALGRLTAEHAETLFAGDRSSGETNALRGQLAQAQDRIQALEERAAALEESRLLLEAENTLLKQRAADAEAAIASDEAANGADDSAKKPAIDTSAADLNAQPRPARAGDAEADEKSAQARLAAATAALIALAKTENDQARAGSTGPGLRPEGGEARQVVDELREIAAAPRPSEPEERQRQNAHIRDRIAGLAARVIQLTAAKEGANSPLAKIFASPQPAGQTPADSLNLADRVRRLTRSRDDAGSEAEDDLAEQPIPAPVEEHAIAGTQTVNRDETATPGNTSSSAKRRRGRARARQRSPR